MNEPASLIIHGSPIQTITINLTEEWNLIGWPSLATMELDDAFKSIEGKYTNIHYYKGESGWSYNAYYEGDWFGDLKEIKPGVGFWLKVREDCVLRVECIGRADFHEWFECHPEVKGCLNTTGVDASGQYALEMGYDVCMTAPGLYLPKSNILSLIEDDAIFYISSQHGSQKILTQGSGTDSYRITPLDIICADGGTDKNTCKNRDLSKMKLAYVSACRTAKPTNDYAFADAFIDAGAKTYVGYTEVILRGYFEDLFFKYSKEGHEKCTGVNNICSVHESLERAKEKCESKEGCGGIVMIGETRAFMCMTSEDYSCWKAYGDSSTTYLRKQ